MTSTSSWSAPDMTEPDTGPFWRSAQQRELRFPWCEPCGSFVSYPPRTVCPSCGGGDLPWHQVTGAATVYAATTIRRHPDPWFGARAPYVLGVVAMDDGPLLLSELLCDPGEDVVDRPAVLTWIDREAMTIPVFEVE